VIPAEGVGNDHQNVRQHANNVGQCN
jgi:hypothetical protein